VVSCIKMNDKELKEMNAVFINFDKRCANAIKACQDFIDMDINKPVENKHDISPYERKRLEERRSP